MNEQTGGPRTLLKRLREVMAEELGAQERLDKIVRHIAGRAPFDRFSRFLQYAHFSETSNRCTVNYHLKHKCTIGIVAMRVSREHWCSHKNLLLTISDSR